jgi:hypothetical protein
MTSRTPIQRMGIPICLRLSGLVVCPVRTSAKTLGAHRLAPVRKRDAPYSSRRAPRPQCRSTLASVHSAHDKLDMKRWSPVHELV